MAELKSKGLRPRDHAVLVEFLDNLPSHTPATMMKKLSRLGYVGQTQAQKAVVLMAYRHILRLKRIFIEGIRPPQLPDKENSLLMGPTGCGKTFLVRLLFQEILKLPTAIIDITSYSETGYVGQDAVSMLTRLIYAAHRNPVLASIGIICIDEFDKLSSGKNNAVFSGAGTTKDVSGIGVQRELLKMLEGAEVDVPMNLSHSSYSDRTTFRTHHVAFIACGAFSGFKRMVERQKKDQIGFGKMGEQDKGAKVAISLYREDIDRVGYFESYGMMPELIGRFSRIIPFRALSKDELLAILKKNTLRQYQKELNLEGVKLSVDKKVIDQIIEEAMQRETGARALRYALNEYLEDALFELYSNKETYQKLRLFVKEDQIQWDLS